MGAVVTSKGQITLPADIRREFDIEQGDEIVLFKCLDGSRSIAVEEPKIVEIALRAFRQGSADFAEYLIAAAADARGARPSSVL